MANIETRPWWLVYEKTAEEAEFIQREPWLTCAAHEGCRIPI